LRDRGHAVSVFEKADSIGGVWHPAHRYPGLRTQSPRDCYGFSDFPMPRDYPEFPDGAQIHRYLLAYADHHGLLSHISLATSVIAVTRREGGSWDVQLRQDGGREWSETFDFVVACNGVFSRPHIPDLPGRPTFEAGGGAVLHSSQLRDLEPLRGRDVIVVGFGKSALDIAEAALPVASSTAIVCNRTLWKVPRYLLGFINAKHLILSRSAELWLPHYAMRGFRRFLHERLPWLVDFYWLMSERSIGRHLGLLQKKLRPQLPLRASIGACFGLAPNDNFRALRSGRMGLHKGRIAGLSSAGLILADGTTVPAQTIVFATGFRQDCPFLAPAGHAALFDNGIPRLYRLLICPRIPGFAVNGYNGGGASQLTAEIGARWIAEMLAGNLKLPAAEEMEAQIDRDLAQHRRVVGAPRGLGFYASPYQFAYLDQLLEDMGQPPADSGKSLWRRYFTAIDPRDYALPAAGGEYRAAGRQRTPPPSTPHTRSPKLADDR
jgi:cation diffusion facilitator CzcD-associated flavoprotein CzcO